MVPRALVGTNSVYKFHLALYFLYILHGALFGKKQLTFVSGQALSFTCITASSSVVVFLPPGDSCNIVEEGECVESGKT